jgi:hypothetical protein
MPVYRITPHALNRMAQRGVDLLAWLSATQDAQWYEDGKRVKVVVRNWRTPGGRGKACDLIVILDHQQTTCITVIRDHRRRSRRFH